MDSSEIFYTKFAPSYAKYASTKNDYLRAVNSFIIKSSKNGASMIDVGAGDGKRSREISDGIKTTNLTLLDNSQGMVNLLKNIAGAKVICGNIADTEFKLEGKFDVVTCLWNVFGHIPDAPKREVAIKNLRGLLKQDGFIFLDVNNRYNMAQYGVKNVLRNMIKDIFGKKQANGDFELDFDVDKEKIKTKVHIFSPSEINKLIKSSGLKIVQRRVINYRTGARCKSVFGGQLLYKLAKA